MAGQKFLSHVTTDRGITSYKQDERHKIDHSRGEKEHWTKEGILENNHLRGDGEGSQK